VISAQPVKGYSPLKVNFSAQKSHSKSGKIIAYLWDFGDGDTSTKKNPENTYWSATFGPRNFTATLTIRDDAGNTSSASAIIEVITK
jgi:microbial collagenase